MERILGLFFGLVLIGGSAGAGFAEVNRRLGGRRLLELPKRALEVIELAKVGDEDGIQTLIDEGVSVDEVDSRGYSALQYCVMNGSLKCVEMLLTAGVPADLAEEDSPTALYIASKQGNLDVAKLLIANGAEVDKATGPFEYTPLFGAVISDSAAIVNELLDGGADVNAKASTSETPIWVAAFLGSQDPMKILVENKANVTIEAYSYLPREVLCRCLTADYFGDTCNTKACKSKEAMKQLLN